MLTKNDFMCAWPTIAVRTSTIEKLYEILETGGFKFNDTDTERLLEIFEEVHEHGIEEGERNSSYPDDPGQEPINIPDMLLKILTAIEIINETSYTTVEVMLKATSATEVILKLRSRPHPAAQWYITINKSGSYISPVTPNEGTRISDIAFLNRFLMDYLLLPCQA